MPYTPPSHRSPASSSSSSPNISRRPSFQGPPTGTTASGTGRPVLPRSASYLTRHRRTPSAVGPNKGHAIQPTPEPTSEDLKAMVSSSVRQSPPPVTESGMPKGAIISPPDSPPSSDDDELPEVRGRNIENLKELQDAISQIPQHRESSPSKGGAKKAEVPGAGDLLVLPSQVKVLTETMHHSFSTSSLDELATGNRRISHVRSATDSSILASQLSTNSLTGSDEDSDVELQQKPQMVRKKSGELVRPALRPSSQRRPSSMPGTPTFSKAVHFDSHLEHVRHFLQVDRPLAVSAGSSPVDNYDSEGEYPFSSDERHGGRSPPYEWELVITNFPVETPARESQPIRLERMWLSNDQKCLIGSVIVTNLAFQKHVTCRFTLDYWKTTSEIAAEYMSEVRPRVNPQGNDRFNFTLKLSDLANLESKTLFLCLRYNVNGQELWDNNNGTNFQVDFRKKMLPQHGKNGVIGAANRTITGLPRSNRRNNPSTAPRPKSMPVGFNEFGDDAKLDFNQSIHDYLGESGPKTLRLKGVRSSSSIASDNLSSRLAAPSGQAFANRYDFGASLTAAVQAAKDAMSTKPDGLYMRSHNRKPIGPPAVGTSKLSLPPTSAPTTSAPATSAPVPASTSRGSTEETATASSAATSTAAPAATAGTVSPNASISSSSYEELVNKYCFFGSKQTSPQIRDGTLRARFDGPDDLVFTQSPTSATSSPEGSPLQIGHHTYTITGGAQHHGLHTGTHGWDVSTVPAVTASLSSPNATILASSQHRASSTSSPATGRTPSPASLVGSFPPFGGTSPNEFTYQHLQDRFPFSGTEAHAPAAIRG